jgi:uncharacterized protein YjbI with pentapeptide repeats
MEIRKNTFHGYLRDGDRKKFNQSVANVTEPIDLEKCNFRGMDLREFNLKNADLKDSYMKNTDLRGVDLSNALLEGASLHRARIAGVLFPDNLAVEEIRMSVDFGTRLRLKKT